MQTRRPYEIVPLGETAERTRSGSERVARRFLPPCPAANLIRLAAYEPRRAYSRRRLARLIDQRRVVS
jgi:hypothetical protein